MLVITNIWDETNKKLQQLQMLENLAKKFEMYRKLVFMNKL